MITLSMRRLLGVGLLIALLGTAMLTASVTSAAPNGATATVKATLHNNWNGIESVPPDLRYQFTRVPHYTLHLTGANFMPGSQVKMALFDTSNLQVLYRGTAAAEPKYLGDEVRRLQISNPLAGTVQYQDSFTANLATAPHLWCRSTNHLDIHNVTMH